MPQLKRCHGCNERYEKQPNDPPFKVWCSPDCGFKVARERQDKARAKKAAKVRREAKTAEKAARADIRVRKERLKTRADWYRGLQKEVNRNVRLRDEGEPCRTCGTTNDIKYDAGHYRSVGSCPELRFELTNIHKQCSVNCNQHGSGMRAEYRDFIVREYGQAHLEWLDGPHPLLKDKFPHIDDIKAEIARYRKLNRSMK
jgi:hypothetical protein